ncbi:MAG: competence protein ComEC, partial [Pseudohongiellaceae bacterium]
EANAESELVRHYGSGLESTVLIAPHHGSNTSSTTEFIAAVAPRFVVISAGYRNQFGHPTAPVLNRYARAEVEVQQTTLQGMLGFAFSDAHPEPLVTSFRQQRPRYWH